MRAIANFAAGSAIALSMFAASAQAASVYVAFDNGTDPVQEVLFDPNGGVFAVSLSQDDWDLGGFDDIVISGNTPALPSLLHSQSVEANTDGSANAAITLYVTYKDIVGTMPQFGYISNFTSNNSREGFSVTLETYADAGNSTYGGTLLSSRTFTGVGAEAAPNVFAPPLAPFTGTYSVTHKYIITDVGGSNASTSPSITLAAVPEPGTWALMIMGFGGAGAMIRSRRRAAAVA